MPEDSYSLGLLKKGYRMARKYLMPEEQERKEQAGQTGQAPAPGKTRDQIAREEAAANKGTENMTPTFTRKRSVIQGVKDRALEKGATKPDPDNPGKRKKKGFGLKVVAKSFLGGNGSPNY